MAKAYSKKVAQESKNLKKKPKRENRTTMERGKLATDQRRKLSDPKKGSFVMVCQTRRKKLDQGEQQEGYRNKRKRLKAAYGAN